MRAILPKSADVARRSNRIVFLFLMQVGLILGFLTGYPAVAWLVGRGTKATV